MLLAALMAATLVSEDLACISAGLLVRDGRVDFVAATTACAVGILVGDVGLWAAGRVCGSAVGRWPTLARCAARLPVDDMRRWLDEHAALAMLGSRFMPGTRLPLYVCAGLAGVPFRRFTVWAAVAVAIWTPILIWLSATSSSLALTGVSIAGWSGWTARLAVVAAVFMTLRTVSRRLSRARALTARLARWTRWEFWPMWLFYAPVAAWLLWLAVRYRGLSTITASNPGIPDGGVVGESKFDILSKLPAEWTVASALVGGAAPAERARQALEIVQERGWRFPVILKPDVGQRGVGVKLARQAADVHAYCALQSGPIVVQPYHPGPFEAGIFYYRFPWEPRGRVFSITDKHFPQIVGDGVSTLEMLIWAHPRYRLQATTFFARHRRVLGRVLATGEALQLAIAGNHAQGTLFRDGWHLWTPELERRIDEIARAYPGFFVGRFDVRYEAVASLQAGRGFAIVELNGATAESTDIYDPDRSLVSAYRKLFRQWAIVFAIGAANRAAGAPVTDVARLIRLVHAHATSQPAFALSD
jgi:membrane protein DedA with SNARE-associated domain